MHGKQNNAKAELLIGGLRRKEKTKTVLLVGGAGHIGSYVTKKLLELNFNVVIYDAFIQYCSPLENNYNKIIQFRFSDDRVKIIRGLIENKKLLKHTIDQNKPSHIINLAATPLAQIGLEYSEEYYKNIIEGNTNCLEIINNLDYSIERFMYISSSMVYGNFTQTPCPENHQKNPINLYGGFKYASEILTKTYCGIYHIPWTIIRPASVYGPGDCNMRFIQSCIEKAIKQETISLRYNGSLDFTYVEDTADGIVLALLNPNAENKTYNITRGEGHTLKDVIEILKQYYPSIKTDEVFLTLDCYAKRGALDIAKAKEEIQYSPKHSLEEGIKKYVEWYQTF